MSINKYTYIGRIMQNKIYNIIQSTWHEYGFVSDFFANNYVTHCRRIRSEV